MKDKVLYTSVFLDKKEAMPDWWDYRRSQDPILRMLDAEILSEDRRLDDTEAAETAIAESHQPGQKTLAVSFYGEKTLPPEAKKIRAKADRLDTQISTVFNRGYESLREGKSPLVACRGCKSRLARKYLKVVACPLCGHEMLSTRRRERVERLRGEIETLTQELEKHTEVPKKNGPVYWLVGGWVRREEA